MHKIDSLALKKHKDFKAKYEFFRLNVSPGEC